MKKQVLSILLVLASVAGFKAQNVIIPDAVFKSILVSDPLINTNSDGEISLAEANAYKDSLMLKDKKIASLTGIEAFTNLTKLDCSYNPIGSLDVTKNTA